MLKNVKAILLLLGCMLIFTSALFSQRSITVNNAGSAIVNRVFTENTESTMAGKPYFQSADQYGQIYWSGSAWYIYYHPSHFYTNGAQTDLPPESGWTLTGSGVNPTPTLSGTGTNEDSSLPVTLSNFSALQQGNTIQLSWKTESEVNNIGFLLERKSEITDWKIIASYKTHDEFKGQRYCSYTTDYTFIDMDVITGETYFYRLSNVNLDGNLTIKDVISIILDKTPELTELLPAEPNPFNPSTKIQYSLAENSDVTLSVINMKGQTVQTIISGQNQIAGSYSVHWNGQNQSGINAPSGIYLLVLNAGQIIKSQKIMLVR